MHFLDDLVWASIKGLAWVGSKVYGVNVKGLDAVELPKAAVFGFRHPSYLDLPLALHVLPRKTMIFASSWAFSHPLPKYLMTVAGAVPLYTPPDYQNLKALPSNTRVHRDFFDSLQTDRWIAYAPEGGFANRTEEVYPQLLIKGAKHGANTYLVGVGYANEKRPWLSFLRLPWKSGIQVRIERYNLTGKTEEQVKMDIREAFGRLSGLETREATSNYAPTNI
jgi:hypothetical protein